MLYGKSGLGTSWQGARSPVIPLVLQSPRPARLVGSGWGCFRCKEEHRSDLGLLQLHRLIRRGLLLKGCWTFGASLKCTDFSEVSLMASPSCCAPEIVAGFFLDGVSPRC